MDLAKHNNMLMVLTIACLLLSGCQSIIDAKYAKRAEQDKQRRIERNKALDKEREEKREARKYRSNVPEEFSKRNFNVLSRRVTFFTYQDHLSTDAKKRSEEIKKNYITMKERGWKCNITGYLGKGNTVIKYRAHNFSESSGNQRWTFACLGECQNVKYKIIFNNHGQSFAHSGKYSKIPTMRFGSCCPPTNMDITFFTDSPDAPKDRVINRDEVPGLEGAKIHWVFWKDSGLLETHHCSPETDVPPLNHS